MWTLLVSSFFLTAFLTGFRYRGGKPLVQLGDTTLIGKRLRPSNLEFFGGLFFFIYDAISSSSLTFQVSLSRSLPLTVSAFLLPSLNIPSPPCNHSTLVIMVYHAYSLYYLILAPPSENSFVSAAMGWEHDRGLSYAERIQTFRCWR